MVLINVCLDYFLFDLSNRHFGGCCIFLKGLLKQILAIDFTYGEVSQNQRI